MLRFLVPIFIASLSHSAHAEWQALFNGKDLEGWTGDPQLWSVVDGVLTAKSDAAYSSTSPTAFLIWQGAEPDDFELEFKAKVVGSNSGVQYRSRVTDAQKLQVRGFQFDLHIQPNYLGMVFDEGGRGTVCLSGQQVKLGEKPEVTGKFEVTPVDLAQWNSYRIVAHGSLIQHFINEQLVAELRATEAAKTPSKGIIALQVQTDHQTVAEFKDIRIQHITRSKTAPKPNAEARSSPMWIWRTNTPANGEKVFFRREIQLPPAIGKAEITIGCDDHHHLFVNNHDIGNAGDWSHPHTYDISSHLKEGRNIIAIEGRNVGGSAALAVLMTATLSSGKTLQIVSDENWICSGEAAEDWRNLDFKADGWNKAAVVAEMGDEPWGDIMPAPDAPAATP